MATRLRGKIAYDPLTGTLTRQDKNGIARAVTEKNKLGYVQLSVDGKYYYGHRLAWWFVHGEWPKGDLDHINGDPSDNRIANLRLAAKWQNSANAKRRGPGLKGTWWMKDRRKWHAAIRHDGRQIHLGSFDDEQSAHAAYCDAARRFKGEFARFD